MKIDRISQILGSDLQKTGGNPRTDKAEKPSRMDSVVLSRQGKELAESGSAAAALARVESLPEVRPEKVQEAKDKIASGYFDSPEFMDRLAERLMKEFGFQNPG